MPKNQYQCSVQGCKEKYIMTHRFPNPRLHKARLLDWIRLVGLSNMNPEIVYNKKRICHSHFSDDCFSPGTKRLNANAYPTLFMPVSSSEVTYFIHDVPSEHQTLQQHSTPTNQHFNLETSCNGVDNVSSIKVADPPSLCSSDNLDVSGVEILNLENTDTETTIIMDNVMSKLFVSSCMQVLLLFNYSFILLYYYIYCTNIGYSLPWHVML
ncbi:uncharacterized protein LOC111039873 [Myzus persicae]|uniref:uncharacterized protein LOC111039873 n=1 Tax=Myzus persicae TaxID=13164 RepID=UPI000B9389DF|nr:uncharacterized protein LOC111039873 [Myzus persicae]